MTPRLFILTIDASGGENCWLVDEYQEQPHGERDLYRAGQYIITLGPDDYANGWEEMPWCSAPLGGSGIESEIMEDEDGEEVLVMHLPTLH